MFSDQNMVEPQVHALAGGSAAVYSARAPDKETPNEDAAALIPHGDDAVLVVADGLGGGPAGERAAGLAIESLRASIDAALRTDTSLRSAIMDGFENAHSAVRADGAGGATTLAVVELSDGTVRTYHVGDSMVFAFGLRGKIKLQTISHSPLGYAVEAGIMEESEAIHHDDRHLVSNVVGLGDMRIEVGHPLRLARRDTVLLCSDGLLDNLHTAEIVEAGRKGPLLKAAKRLAERARKRMTSGSPSEGVPSKPDDLTFILFRRWNDRSVRAKTVQDPNKK